MNSCLTVHLWRQVTLSGLNGKVSLSWRLWIAMNSNFFRNKPLTHQSRSLLTEWWMCSLRHARVLRPTAERSFMPCPASCHVHDIHRLMVRPSGTRTASQTTQTSSSFRPPITDTTRLEGRYRLFNDRSWSVVLNLFLFDEPLKFKYSMYGLLEPLKFSNDP